MKILYEDNHIIVVVKAPGVLSQASALDLPDMLTMVKKYIKETYDKPGNVYCGLVHRLDLNVGGVMVFAKTSKAARRLSQQIRDHQFNKHYFAVVEGGLMIDQKMHTLENYIKKDHQSRKAFITNNPNDSHARLVYQAIESISYKQKTYTLVDLELITGRFHQIRAQFAHINHPLFGDNKYGQPSKGYELGLYAYELSFQHPTLKKDLTYYHYPSMGIFNQFKMFKQGEKTDDQ